MRMIQSQNRDVLIFVGQDAEGEWIPPIEEREVQYLHNIAVRVSSTDKITFDVSVSDFVRKDYLDQKLEEHMRHSGHIFVGAADTEIREGDVLLIMDIGGGASGSRWGLCGGSSYESGNFRPAPDRWGITGE